MAENTKTQQQGTPPVDPAVDVADAHKSVMDVSNVNYVTTTDVPVKTTVTDEELAEVKARGHDVRVGPHEPGRPENREVAQAVLDAETPEQRAVAQANPALHAERVKSTEPTTTAPAKK